MSHEIDDQEMIPDWAGQKILGYETSAKGLISEKNKFEDTESSAAEFIESLIESDLKLISQKNPDLYKENDNLYKALNFLLWRSMLRGWHLAEGKWKAGVFILPSENRDRNPNSYTPGSKDFE